MIIFSWINAQNIFFTYLIYKIILFGGWIGSRIPGDKKALKWIIFATATEWNEGAIQLMNFWIHVLDRTLNVFYMYWNFMYKIKFWSKVLACLAHEIKGTNFWETLYIVLCERNAKDVSFEWSYHRISTTDYKTFERNLTIFHHLLRERVKS